MRRDAKACLANAQGAAESIARFMGGASLHGFLSDELVQSAVERQFITLGNALTTLSKIDFVLGERVPDRRKIIGFRNLLVHGYGAVDPALLYRLAREDAPKLRNAVAAMLAELEKKR
jgi:uncharacterized protein with HEPN domain